MSSDNEDSLKLRRRVSIVWSYFEKISRNRVKCKLCQHEQNYQGTTGNILRHLKNKHNVDATVKAQTTTKVEINAGVQLLMAKDSENEHTDITVKAEQSPDDVLNKPREKRLTRSEPISYCEDTDIDPYGEATIQFDQYINLNAANATKKKEETTPKISLVKDRKMSVEEARILAETEYFREKAGYYRMQKNLTALQAKKIKYELDQLG